MSNRVQTKRSGFIEVADLPEYPEEDVEECIKNCPADCIAWEEV